MKILRSLALISVLGAALVCCRKELPTTIDPRDRLINNWSDAFEAYWDGMNHNYAFWDIDPTDWDKVYVEYKPKFANLKLNKFEDDSIAMFLIMDMSKTLIDHHMVIQIETDIISFAFVPRVYETINRPYYHDSYNKKLLYDAAQRNETAGRITNMKFGVQPTARPGEQIELLSYLIDGDVAYMTFNHFAIEYALYTPIYKALENFLNIIEETPELKGIIVDVRQNSGGNTNDIKYIIGPLINTEHLFGYSHTKNGLGRLDYSPWTPWIIEPIQHFSQPITIPIVALIDLNSISMSEVTAMAIQTLPNGYVVGERSAGAMGPIVTPFNISYAGPYDTEIMSVFTSSHRSTDRDGNCLEGIGITPDIEALLDMEVMNAKVDNQLERAIEFIHTGR